MLNVILRAFQKGKMIINGVAYFKTYRKAKCLRLCKMTFQISYYKGNEPSRPLRGLLLK